MPTPAEVQRIAGIDDPVVRNLSITHAYAQLSAAMHERTGGGANWCTFATWASRQAGSTIRGEDATAFVGRRLAAGAEWLHPVQSLWRLLLRRGLLNPRSRLGRLTAAIHTPFDAVEAAAEAVSRGNRKVFAEIGLEFARYLEARDAAAVRAFLDALRPGDPPEGQRYLRQAFAHYEALAAEPSEKRRAELLLAANLAIGLHEQTRLQPEIRSALDAAYDTEQDLGRRLLELLLPAGTRTRRAVPDRPAAAALGWAAGKVEAAGAEVAREVITGSLMVLSLPGRVLALGTHLSDAFPDALREVDDRDLAELIRRFEPAPPAPDDCGARDWAVLEQRMHYISHLFRATQDTTDLHDPPFTDAQVARILAGAIPDGDL